MVRVRVNVRVRVRVRVAHFCSFLLFSHARLKQLFSVAAVRYCMQAR